MSELRSTLARALLCAVASVSVATPQTSAPQPPRKVPVVAILVGNRPVLDWIVAGLRDVGLVAEQNFHLEARLTDGTPDKEARFADEIIALKPDVVVATTPVVELKKRSSTLPIVLAGVGIHPPTALGMVKSLEHPGGNVTGVVEGAAAERDVRRLALLKETVPGLVRVAVIGPGVKPEVRAAAAKLGLQLNFAAITRPDQIDAAFDELARNKPQALWVPSGPFSLANMTKIARQAAVRKWPSISESRELPGGGGLMSYGGFGDARQVARYVDRILNGSKPADLPVEVQGEHWTLVINLTSAKELGLTIPDAILAQAAEIIR